MDGHHLFKENRRLKGDVMRAIYCAVLLLSLVGVEAVTNSSSLGRALTEAQTEPGFAEGAFGLRVTDVRELPRRGAIELVFDDLSAEVLRKFSQRAAGHEVDLLVNGRKIATLKLLDPIVGNAVELTGDFSAELRKDLADTKENGVDIRFHH
jgi:hypothetical protein